jgi:hypothetical protein
MATTPHTKPDEQQLEIFRLRGEVERLTRVAQDNFDAHTMTLKWATPLRLAAEKLIASVIREKREGMKFWSVRDEDSLDAVAEALDLVGGR